MSTALLVVDVQEDFLARDGLQPSRGRLQARLAALLDGCRRAQVPVLFVHTRVDPDGRDRMPHWQAGGTWACVAGSPGAAAPVDVAPGDGEVVFYKRFFSGFEDPDLDLRLRELGCSELWVAGLYTHACVRATVLDAYARGYTTTVVADCVASTEALHALQSRQWLEHRAAPFIDSRFLLGHPVEVPSGPSPLPAVYAQGRWRPGTGLALATLADPCDNTRIRARVPVAGAAQVARAVAGCVAAAADWAQLPWSQRRARLRRWEQVLVAGADALARQVVAEIGKPLQDAREELQRALGHLRSAIAVAEGSAEQDGDGYTVRYRPLGVVAAITPWNNPIAIAVAKLAPALAFGNAVVWKPATVAAPLALTLVETLHQAGLEQAPLSVVFGGRDTAQQLMADPRVDGVTLTGATDTGLQAAQVCAASGKPLQAELGGNNAALVMADMDPQQVAPLLAAAAFGFSGQRCTALRRVVAHRALRATLVPALLDAVAALRLGPPDDPQTQMGPLVSPQRLQRVDAVVRHACEVDGGRVLAGGARAPQWPAGCGYLPTVIDELPPHAAAVQEESFGPVLVLQWADDFDHAMALCNGVRHGLVAALFSNEVALQQRFVERAQAGILRVNPRRFPVHPDAPFRGWKGSAIGPAEHGLWDREFYTRVQTVYRAPGEES